MPYSLAPSKATYWSPISDATILDLASDGRLEPTRIKEYIDKGRVTPDEILKNIDFSDPVKGGVTLRKYYETIFFEVAG